MSSSIEFLLLSVVSLFAIINPFSTVPAFLAITTDDSKAERIAMARRGCIVAGIILAVMAVAGQWIFTLLGITLPALQIAGGIVLFAIGFEMLRAPEPQTRLNPAEKAVAQEKDDIAISPLAIPLLCGPGAISTVIILQTQAAGLWEMLWLLGSVPIVYLACFLILRISASGSRWLTPIVLRVLRRFMGLLFVIIAAQFVINGISELPFIAHPHNMDVALVAEPPSVTIPSD